MTPITSTPTASENLRLQAQQVIGGKKNISVGDLVRTEEKSYLPITMKMKDGSERTIHISSVQTGSTERLAEIFGKLANINSTLKTQNQSFKKLFTSEKTRVSARNQLELQPVCKKQNESIKKSVKKFFTKTSSQSPEKSENTNPQSSQRPTSFLPKNIRDALNETFSKVTNSSSSEKTEKMSKLDKMYTENKETFDLLKELCTLIPKDTKDTETTKDTKDTETTKDLLKKADSLPKKETLSLVKKFADQAIKEKCVGTESFKLAEHFLSRLTGPGGTVGESQLREIRGDSKAVLEGLSAKLACVQSRGTLNARYSVIEKYISASIKVESEIKANTPISLINAKVGSKQKKIFDEANKKTSAMEMSKGINDLCGFISKAVLAWDPVLSDWSKKLEGAIKSVGTDKEKEESLKKLQEDLKEFKTNIKNSLEVEKMNSLNDVDKMAETLGDSLISKLPAIVSGLTKAGINLAPG